MPELRLFNRRTDLITPFGPRAIIIADVLEPEQIRKHEPSVTGALTDSAINDGVRARFHAAVIEIDLRRFVRRFKCGVIIRRGFPRHALWPRTMAAAQHSFLRILRHMRDLAAKFARRTHVDQRFAALALCQCLIEKRADLLVEPRSEEHTSELQSLRHLV